MNNDVTKGANHAVDLSNREITQSDPAAEPAGLSSIPQAESLPVGLGEGAAPEASEQTPTPQRPGGNKPFMSLKRMSGFALIVAAFGIGTLIYASAQGKPVASTTTALAELSSQSIPLAALSQSLSASQSATARQLTVNGQLSVAGPLVLVPSSQPTGATAGELYYDSTSNLLSYYNGKQFVNLQGGGNVTNNVTNVAGNTTNVTNLTDVTNVTNGGGGGVAGTGTPGDLAYFATADSLSDSLINESGTTLDVGGTILNVGTGNGVQSVAVGSGNGAAATSVQGGTGGLALTTGTAAGASGNITLESGTSATTAAGNVTVDTGAGFVSGTVVQDNDFETGIDGIEPWILPSTTAQDCTVSHSGNCSLAVTGNAFWGILQNNPDDVSVTAGHHYFISMWVKAATTGTPITGALIWGGGGLGFDTSFLAFPVVTTTTAGWTQLTASGVAPAGAITGQFRIGGTGGTSNGTQYIDDLTVTDLSSGSSSSELDLGANNAQVVSIGNMNEVAPTTIDGGSGINLNAGTANIDVNGGAITVDGSGASSFSTTSGSLTLGAGGGTAGGVIVKPQSDTTTDFQVQSAGGINLLTADSTDREVSLGVGAGGALGSTSEGSNVGSAITPGTLAAFKFTTGVAGTLGSMSVYIGVGQTVSPNNQYQLAIYDDNGGVPGNYVGSTGIGTLTSPSGWNTLSLTSPVNVLANTSYWLVFWANGNDTITYSNGFPSATVDGVANTWQSGPDNGLPATYPSGSVSTGSLYSMYASYTTNGPATIIGPSGTLTQDGAAVFQDPTDTSQAFQVQDASGNSVFTVDTNADQVVLGTPGSLAGQLTLANAGTTQTVALQGLSPSSTGNATIQFPSIPGGTTDTVCLFTLGNCSIGGGGGGVGGSGTADKLAKFTGSGTTVGDSSITDTGSSITVQPTSDSTSAFQVKNASGSNTLLSVDSTNSAVTLGTTNGAATTSIYAGSGGVTIQGGTGGVAINTGSGTGTTAGIGIQTGDSSTGNSGNVTIDNGANTPSGTQISDFTFESSTENFGNYINVSVAQSTAQAHGGTHSLAVTEQGSGLWATTQGGGLGPTVTPGHIYALSAWIRADTVAETISGQVQWWNGQAGTTTWASATDTTTGWTHLFGNVVAPAVNPGHPNEQMDLQFAASNGTNGQIQYIDDATVTDLSTVASPSINIGATNAQAINIGNYQQAGLTSLLGGGAGIDVLADTNANVDIGTANANDVTVGNTGGGLLTFQGSGVTQYLGSVDLVQSTTDSPTAFQIQDSAGNSLLTADTTNNAIVFGQDDTPTDLTVRGGAATGTNASGANITFDASNGTGAGGSGSFIFRTAKPSGSAVTLDNTGNEIGDDGNCGEAKLSFTTGSQSNRVLVVTVISDVNYTSVSYDGFPLTQLAVKDNSVDVEMWYLLNPPSGTHDVLANIPNCTGMLIGASSYYNVDQTTPFGTVATASGTTTGLQSTSLNVVTTSAAQLVVDGIGTDGDDPTVNPGQTQIWNQPPSGGNWPAAGSYAPGTGGTVNMNWSVNNADWADIGVPINPTSNSITDTLSDSLVIGSNGVGVGTSNPTHTLDVGGDANFQDASDSTQAFQIQDAAGNALFTADTANDDINDTGNLIVNNTAGCDYSDYVSAMNGLSPASYWKLEDTGSTAVDSSGNGNDGTLSNVTPDQTPGAFTCAPSHPAMLFSSASNSQITTPNAINSPNVYSEIALFKTNGGSGVLESFSDNVTSWDREMYVGTDGRLYAGIFNNGQGVQVISSAGSVADGNWHMAVVTESSSGLFLYLDGRLVGANPGYNNPADYTNGTWWIGNSFGASWPNMSNTAFDGEISQAAVSLSVVTAPQIQTLATDAGVYNAELASIGVGTTSPQANIDDEGTALFRDPNNTSTAFQVQTAAGVNLISVDGTNQTVTLGAASGNTGVVVQSNNDTTTASQLTVQQAGSGDSSIQLADANTSFYEGVNPNAGDSFNINSAATAQQAVVIGNNLASMTNSCNDSNSNEDQTTQYTAQANGTLTSLNVAFDSGGGDPFSVAIYSDNAGTPGTLLDQHTGTQTITAPSPGSPNWNNITLDTPLNVTVGTNYWLVIGTSSSGDVFYATCDGSGSDFFQGSVTPGTWNASWFGNGTDDGNGNYHLAIYGSYSGTSDIFHGSLFNLTTSGAATLQNSTDSTSAFQVQDATGSDVIDVDTVNGRVGIDTAPTVSALQVSGTTSVGYVNSLGAFGVMDSGGAPEFDVDTVDHDVQLQAPTNATSFVPTANSDGLQLLSNYWNGSATAYDSFTLQNVASTSSPFETLQIENNGGTPVVSIDGNGATTFQNSSDSATAFVVQNTGNTPLLTADTTHMIVTVTALTVSADLTVDGHVITGGSTPGIAAGTAACTSPTVSVAGDDTSGTITITTGSGCSASGKLATITFATAFGAAPHVTLTAGGSNAAALNAYVDDSTVSPTSFDLGTGTTPSNTSTYEWNYWVAQ